MRTITINIKYNVGDKVWIMCNNYPTLTKIKSISVIGGIEDAHGVTSDLGRVFYSLCDGSNKEYTEEQLCDTFEQLRDKVFCEELKEQ